jgi:hypothetical protein
LITVSTLINSAGTGAPINILVLGAGVKKGSDDLPLDPAFVQIWELVKTATRLANTKVTVIVGDIAYGASKDVVTHGQHVVKEMQIDNQKSLVDQTGGQTFDLIVMREGLCQCKPQEPQGCGGVCEVGMAKTFLVNVRKALRNASSRAYLHGHPDQTPAAWRDAITFAVTYGRVDVATVPWGNNLMGLVIAAVPLTPKSIMKAGDGYLVLWGMTIYTTESRALCNAYFQQQDDSLCDQMWAKNSIPATVKASAGEAPADAEVLVLSRGPVPNGTDLPADVELVHLWNMVQQAPGLAGRKVSVVIANPQYASSRQVVGAKDRTLTLRPLNPAQTFDQQFGAQKFDIIIMRDALDVFCPTCQSADTATAFISGLMNLLRNPKSRGMLGGVTDNGLAIWLPVLEQASLAGNVTAFHSGDKLAGMFLMKTQ